MDKKKKKKLQKVEHKMLGWGMSFTCLLFISWSYATILPFQVTFDSKKRFGYRDPEMLFYSYVCITVAAVFISV